MSSLRDRNKRKDAFYKRAKKHGFAARSVFKLEELDKRFKLFRSGQKVLDLGCRPGSWLQYASGRVGSKGYVVGLDREPLDIPEIERSTVLVGDVLTIDPEQLRGALPDRSCFQLVLSDMAPDTSGIAFTDQVRSVELFTRALELASELGCPNSSFVAKVFMGADFQQALTEAKQAYKRVKTVKPDATRSASKEVYVVAQQKK